MAITRGLRPLAELATRKSQSVVIQRPTLLANHYCSCHGSKAVFSRNNPSESLQSRWPFSVRRAAAYSTTSSMLSSSSSPPFRLKSIPKQQQQHENSNQTLNSEHDGFEGDEIEEGGEGGEGGRYYSPYKPKRQWPPDLSKLSHKHQLRLERKYRRRAALKYARPRWVRGTKLAQWGVIIFVVIYSIFFMEWAKEGEKHPLEEFRKDFFASLNSLFSTPQPPRRKNEQ